MRGAWLDDDGLPAWRNRAEATEPGADGESASDATASDDERAAPGRSAGAPGRGGWLPTDPEPTRTGTLADTTRAPAWAVLLCVIGFGAVGAMILTAVLNSDGELLTGSEVGIVLLLVSITAFRFIAKHDENPALVPLLTAALSVKIIGTFARYQVGTSVYDRSDATNYDTYGRRWATDYLSHGALPGVKSWSGTNFIRLLTAELYNILPASEFAAFIVFSWLSFVGLILFWRAFRRVYPNGERKYFYLVMFAPSMVYWPSSLGKEAIVILGLGAATYGFARCLTKAVISGTAFVAAGIVLVTYVRAHVALVLLIGMFFAVMLRKRPKGQLIGTVATLLVFVVVGLYVGRQANSYFKTDVSNTSDVSSQFSDAVSRTHQGGSEFNPVPIHSPADFPYAAITVLFRPFPWESGSIQELLTSFESLVYAGVLITGAKRLAGRVRRDQPIALYAFGTTVVFIIVFSNFANFGILARQRTQVLPFLFMLLCVPERPKKDRYTPIMQQVLEKMDSSEPAA